MPSKSAELLAAALEADADAHGRSDFEKIRTRFDSVRTEIPGIAELPEQMVRMTLWFWDDWGNASKRNWSDHVPYIGKDDYKPIQKDDWPRLARMIAGHVREGSMPDDRLMPKSFRLRHQYSEVSEQDRYDCLKDVLSGLGDYFSRTAQYSMTLLILSDGPLGKCPSADVALLSGRRRCGVYRLEQYMDLADAIFDMGDYGELSLVGIPPEMIPKLLDAAENGSISIALDHDSSLRTILETNTPWFELATFPDESVYSSTYSPNCPEDIRQILDRDVTLLPPRYRPPEKGLLDRLVARLFRK